MQDKHKKIRESIEKNVEKTIQEFVSGSFYNAPFYQTDNKEETVQNFEAHNRNRTSFKKPTKDSVETIIPGFTHADENWYKVQPLGDNKNISKATNKDLLHENKKLLKEATPQTQQNQQLKTQPQNNQQQTQAQNVPKNNNQQVNNQQPEQNADPLDFLYAISRHDVILFYNSIIAPFFAFWKNKFNVEDKGKRLPLFDLYIQCDLHLSKLTEKDDEDQKNLYKYKKLQDANNSLIPAIKTAFAGLNSALIQDDKTEIDTIKTKIQNGIEAISKSLYQILLPISNGYIQTLEGVNNPAIKSLGDGAKQSNVIVKSIKIIQDDAKRFLLSRFKAVIEHSSGTWLISRIQASINGFSPTISINVEGKKNDTQFNLLTENEDAKNFIDQFKKPFDETNTIVSDYNKKFHDFVSNIDITQFKNIMTRIDATTVIKKYLRTQGAGLFDKISDNVAKEIATQLKQYTKNNQELQQKNNEEQEKENLNTTKGYLLKTLEFDKDNLTDEELDYAEIITKNFTDFKIQDGQLNFRGLGNYTQPKQLHEIIIGTFRGQGNLLEFTQNWFAIAHKYELILWSAGKMDFDQILRNYSKENKNDPDENSDLTKQTVPSLTEAIGNTSMKAYINGHDLNWSANRSTAIALPYLNHYGYVKDLAKLPDTFWNYIFGDTFKKDKLFTDSQINNPEDIKKAEEKLGGSENIDNKTPFNDYINKYVETMPSIDSQYQTDLGISNFKQLTSKYSGNLENLDNNKANEIGIITNKFLMDFLNKYGKTLKPQNTSLANHNGQAKYLSEKLLSSYYGKNLRKEQIDQLQKGIEDLLDNPQNGKELFKPTLETILKCLNKIMSHNNQFWNDDEDNNQSYEMNDNNF